MNDTVPMQLYKPESKVQSYGVQQKSTWTKVGTFFGTFKTYGGSERESNGGTVVEDTATIDTWYSAQITSDRRIKFRGTMYEIIGEPEDFSARNHIMRIKVRAVKGNA